MKGTQRILDFRNRPPYSAIFDLKRNKLGNPLKRKAFELWLRWLTKSIAPYRNRGAAMLTPSMQRVSQPDAMAQWWREIGRCRYRRRGQCWATVC